MAWPWSPTTTPRHQTPPDVPISVHSESSRLQALHAFLNVQMLECSTCKFSWAYPLYFLRLSSYWPKLTCTTETRLTPFPSSPCSQLSSPRRGVYPFLLISRPVYPELPGVARHSFTPGFEGHFSSNLFRMRSSTIQPDKSFRMPSYEKKGRGVRLLYLGQRQRPPTLQIISPKGACQAYGLTLLSKAKLPSNLRRKSNVPSTPGQFHYD